MPALCLPNCIIYLGESQTLAMLSVSMAYTVGQLHFSIEQPSVILLAGIWSLHLEIQHKY